MQIAISPKSLAVIASKHTQDTSAQRWPTVYDIGLALDQQRVDVSCLLA